MEMGDEAEQQNKKGGRRVKKKGAKRRRRPETEWVRVVNGGRVVNRRESHTEVKRRWDPGRHRHGGESKKVGGQRADGREKRELQAQESAQHEQQCAVSSLVANENQLQGPHVLRLVWDRKPLVKAVVPTKVGSREYGYG